VLKEHLYFLIALLRGTGTKKLADGECPAPIHIGMYASGVGLLPRKTQVLIIVKLGVVKRGIKQFPGNFRTHDSLRSNFPVLSVLLTDHRIFPALELLGYLFQRFRII